MEKNDLALPLEAPALSRLGWKLLRVLDEEGGAGFFVHLVQRLEVDEFRVKAALNELEGRRIISQKRSTKRSDAEGKLEVSFTLGARDELRRFLRMVCKLDESLTALTGQRNQCAAQGLGRARCFLEAGHIGQHLDFSHPALRPGEILRWDDGVT